MVAGVGSAQLVTVGADGYPLATLLPVAWQGDTVIAHMARANPHWTQIGDGSPVLLVVAGPQAYISPSWYASKAEHGRVVPTWNYITAHVHGRLVILHDPAWVEANVRRLTTKYEATRPEPWSVDDAPAEYVAGQVRAIVGVEIVIDRVEGKVKLSQNRSDADIAGAIEGLEARGEHRVSSAMRALGRANND
jgi:transcriptional regulator